MLFTSFEFAWFFAGVYALYLVFTHRAQNTLLLAASYAFYAAWSPRLLSLIILSTLVDYVCSGALEKSTANRKRKWILALSLSTNLGLLCCYKYYNFFVDGLSALLQSFGVDTPSLRLDIVLPIGISFYTFQTMSYTIDVYKGKIRACPHLLDFALFVSFFPQLVAGPIERASRLLPQIRNRRHIGYGEVRKGLWLILFGIFKKVVIADNLATLVDPVFADAGGVGATATALGVYAFAFQIFCDFSAYSDIARGLAKLMGFDLVRNFNIPYFASNPVEFWRRAHISLSTWLRDYLYIPLGGNRRGRTRTCINLMLTMLLGGLWHGAAWSFVAWGALHGALLVVHRGLLPWLSSIAPTRGPAALVWRVGCWFVFFHIICVGWILFRVESIADFPVIAASFLSAFVEVGGWDGALLGPQLVWFSILLLPLLGLQLAKERSGDPYVVKQWRAPVRCAVYMYLIASIALCGVTERHEFIYFQF